MGHPKPPPTKVRGRLCSLLTGFTNLPVRDLHPLEYFKELCILRYVFCPCRAHTMAQEGMAVRCILTFQYKILYLIQLGQEGSLTTATPLSRNRWWSWKENRTDFILCKGPEILMMVIQNYIPQRLHGFVEIISEQRSDLPYSWTFLPDGISCLMFRINPESKFDIIKAKNLGQHNNPSNHFCFITGISTNPVHISFNNFNYIGAYLKPIALKALFGIAAHDLKDFAIDGSLVLSDLALIEDKLNELPNFLQKAKWLEEWLYARIKETADLNTALAINQLAEKISRNYFNLKGKQLENLMGYSRAQTHRLFHEWFGLSSQKYQRMMKFVRTMEILHSSNEPLTTIGLQQGYFDQAHFIRTFKEFTDMTPSEYRKCKTDLLGQFPTK
jgi:AraC-like DNA-binding protein